MIPIVRLALKVYEKSLSNKNVPCQLDEYDNPTQRVACTVYVRTILQAIVFATSRGWKRRLWRRARMWILPASAMSFIIQQPLQYSVSSGTTQHRTAKPRIRPNNQAPPHNALHHLAPTFTTLHYPISLHISPHHRTTSSIFRNTLHRTTGPTNITYRP